MRCYLSSATPDDATVIQLTAALRDGVSRGDDAHEIVDDPDEADAILLLESPENKFRSYIRLLRRHPLVVAYPEKTFVFEVCDAPLPLLPGLYASLPARHFDRHRVRAFQYWRAMPADLVERAVSLHGDRKPTLLYSFRGFRTARVRGRIFAELGGTDGSAITETTRQFWHSSIDDPGRVDFAREILDSAFVLCPRGSGTSSVRLYEAMQLGRAPVVIADEWVAPDGIPWSDFSIRVAEDRVGDIPAILQQYEERAPEMGRRAKEAWNMWCRTGPTIARHIMDRIEGLAHERPASVVEAKLQRRWESTQFLWRHELHTIQRGARVARKHFTA